jgi:5'-phosphate synthase pdxT subunit
MKVGVFSLQGDYEKHDRMLRRLGVEPVYANAAQDFDGLEGLIIPGGESTTMLKLLDLEEMFDPLLAYARTRPVLGTCAGSILMAQEVTSPPQRSLGLMDFTIERNAYGRQVDSSIQRVQPSEEFERRTAPGELETVFIRAPIIREVRDGVKVLASLASDPILVEQGPYLAATFHPELTDDPRVHQLFLDKVRAHHG